MKTRSILLFCLSAVCLITATGSYAQKSARQAKRQVVAAQTTRTVDSVLLVGRFLFIPNKAISQTPGIADVNLTSYYEVMVTPDSVVSQLPYYGRANNTRFFDPNNHSPLEFTATDFTYEQKTLVTQKGPETTVILQTRPQGGKQPFQLIFTVFANATATLSVQSSGLEEVRFLGNVTSIPRPDER